MQNKIEMEKKIDEVIERFKGKGGDEEAETILVDNNADKRAGLVTVWGCNHNIGYALSESNCRMQSRRVRSLSHS